MEELIKFCRVSKKRDGIYPERSEGSQCIAVKHCVEIPRLAPQDRFRRETRQNLISQKSGTQYLDKNNFVFDHVGIAVHSIEAFLAESILNIFSTQRNEPKILDPLQNVWVKFLELPGSRIELIEPADARSPISNILKDQSFALHHICFRVPNLEKALALAEILGCALIKPPLPAIALDYRKVAFVMGRDRLLWELLEAESSD